MPYPAADLDLAARCLDDADWARLRGQRLLITGASGFVGRWLMAVLQAANTERRLGLELLALSRQAQPETPGLRWLQGDVRRFRLDTPIDLAIHAAVDVAQPGSEAEVFDVCVNGTRQLLDQARAQGAQRVLLLSSGAVYGPGAQPWREDTPAAPDCLNPAQAYAEGKRGAEMLAALSTRAGLPVPVARCFAFVGPGLPLNRQFAIGNFLAAARAGRPLQIAGDGTPLRSYLHAAELAGWLLRILLRGTGGRAYNVGGAEAVSIRELAERVRRVSGQPALPLQVAQTPPPGAVASAYLPNLQRARDELGLVPRLGLDEALHRTWAWLQAQPPALAGDCP